MHVSRIPQFDAITLEVCRPLGRGAFGEVFLVRALPASGDDAAVRSNQDSSLEFLALKRVSVAQLSDAGAAKALEEAKLLRRLSEEHHSILRCFDFRITSDSSAHLELLLEFAPLGDLSCRIRSHRVAHVAQETGLPEAEVTSYGGDIAAGLAYLHALRPKVFHRDIKPANVVLFYGQLVNGVSGVPRAKLADFGIAKVMESEGSFAGAATVIGTPHYFAPEICRGEGYDERADAWAFGCVLYEMMCLHRPFHKVESNLALLALRISEGKYDKDALQKQARHYNGLLIFTLVGLLNFELEQRSRASDVVQPLQELQAAAPGSKEPLEAWWLEKTSGSCEPTSQQGNAVGENSDSWQGAVKPDISELSPHLAPAFHLGTSGQGEDDPITILPDDFKRPDNAGVDVPITGESFAGVQHDESGSIRSKGSTQDESRSQPFNTDFAGHSGSFPQSCDLGPEAPQTECLGEVFFSAAGIGGGAAAKLAWAFQGEPETSHDDASTKNLQNGSQKEESHQPGREQDIQSRRLFLRPLWPNADNGGLEDPPVLLRFASISREQETPSSQTVAGNSSVPAKSQAQTPRGWMEVRFSGNGGEILVHGEADDHGIFSLTSLE